MTDTKEQTGIDRRGILIKMASAAFAGLVAPAVLGELVAPAPAEAAPLPAMPTLPAPQPDEDPLLRMMRDLQRALQKPIEQRHWVMVIDLGKCVGCHACTIACAIENKLPPGNVYRPVLEEEVGEYPHVTRRFIPRPCMQCGEPPCVDVCPVNATWKRPDGIVAIDYEKCIGCRYCITACPYNARVFDLGHTYTESIPLTAGAVVGQETASGYETTPAFEYGKEWQRTAGSSPIGNARKCHFCIHRIEQGLLPACTTTCIGRATYFGDSNDHDSMVAELIARPNVRRLKEEMGTRPNVYYLT